MKKKIRNFPPELRMDVVNQDWVIIAPQRSQKPNFFTKKSKKILKKECPFCNIKTQEKPLLIFSKGNKIFPNKEKNSLKEIKKLFNQATIFVFPNKYPALLPSKNLKEELEGNLFKKMRGVGFHEVVVFKNHSKQIAEFKLKEVKELFDVYQERYLSLMKKRFVNYISIFHNQGFRAGASIPHPHSQILTTPLIDSDLKKVLIAANEFFKKEKKCLYCEMVYWEKKLKKRVVFENKNFIALCPFASKSAFEVIISPKKHLSYFEKITENEKRDLARVFLTVMKKIFKGLNNPDYNFHLHTAPCDKNDYSYYHWHWTIIPRVSNWAGFEIGTRMEIITIPPEKAAEYLRKQK